MRLEEGVHYDPILWPAIFVIFSPPLAPTCVRWRPPTKNLSHMKMDPQDIDKVTTVRHLPRRGRGRKQEST